MNDLTDAIYWASKDPKVLALQTLILPGNSLPDLAAREAQGALLDAEGFVIDRQIDIYGWDPTKVMASWAGAGLDTVPAAAFNGSTVPKFIKVSNNAADYPPITAAPPPLPPVKPVGIYIGNGEYAATNTCLSNGQPIYQNGVAYPNVNGDGKTYVFHAIPFWGVWSINWTQG